MAAGFEKSFLLGRQLGKSQTAFFSLFLELHKKMNVIQKLDSFSLLGSGWRFGDGVEFSPEVIADARDLVVAAQNLDLEVDVFPGENGEILVAFEEFEVIVEQAKFTLYWEKDSEEEILTKEQIINILKNAFSQPPTSAGPQEKTMNQPSEIIELVEKFIKKHEWSSDFSSSLGSFLFCSRGAYIFLDHSNSILKIQFAGHTLFFSKEEREYLDKALDFRLRESFKDILRKELFK